MKKKKLLIVGNEDKARQLRDVMGDEWEVSGYQSPIMGRKFDLIIYVEQHTCNIEKFNEYKDHLKTRVVDPKNLIEVK